MHTDKNRFIKNLLQSLSIGVHLCNQPFGLPSALSLSKRWFKKTRIQNKTLFSPRTLRLAPLPATLFLILILMMAPHHLVADIVVANTNDSGSGSLRQAIADAASGELITFNSSLSGQTISLAGTELLIDKNLTIDASALPYGITISGNDASRVLKINSGIEVTLDSLTITNGYVYTEDPWDRGAGIFNSGTLTIRNSTVVKNISSSYGAGIYNNHGCTLTLENSTVANNQGSRGGGIWNSGTMTVRNSTVTRNSGYTGGGGIHSALIGNLDSILILENSTVVDNTSGTTGGGLFSSGTLILKNSTVARNFANRGGGGISSNNGTLTLENSTVVLNSADAVGLNGGGGINCTTSTLSLKNTIIANNNSSKTDANDSNGSVTGDNGGNLIGDGTGMSGLTNGQNNNQIGTNTAPIDPMLAPLDNYGGPTPTIPLLPDSPAIDAGVATSLDTDQRGSPRLFGAFTDIGAVEVNYDGIVSFSSEILPPTEADTSQQPAAEPSANVFL